METTLYQHRTNVVSTLFQRRAPTSYQRCATLKIRRRILFHFQRRINVISTLIHNVETTLIRRWNVGWVWCNVLWSADWYFLASDNFQGTFCFMVSTQVLMEELAISWSMFATVGCFSKCCCQCTSQLLRENFENSCDQVFFGIALSKELP